jgi:hypothetical protein
LLLPNATKRFVVISDWIFGGSFQGVTIIVSARVHEPRDEPNTYLEYSVKVVKYAEYIFK